MIIKHRKKILWGYLLLAIISCLLLFRLKFAFSFEQFFPQGDKELEFFQEFIASFETDDNFLMVAIDNEQSVFEEDFLNRVHQFSLEARKLHKVTSAQSITGFKYLVKTPFGVSQIPAIHRNKPELFEQDSIRIMQDERLVEQLISKDATAINILIKTEDYLGIDDSDQLMTGIAELSKKYKLENNHILGRAYFMSALSDMQFREIMVSSIVSIILVSIILTLLLKRLPGVMIALTSIGLGLLIFMGLLGLLGRELNAMAAFYPVLMLIVGTSDVIHIFTKYVDELKNGKDKNTAINITVREIGMATLLTSVTTAAGFLSLLTSKVQPIRDFGLNSAIGVLVAYFVVITFTTALLSIFPQEKIIKFGKQQAFWDKFMLNSYTWNKKNPIKIFWMTMGFIALAAYGISIITTNYQIISNLPRGEKITADFKYFESEFGGFRPMEMAILLKEPFQINDREVVMAIDQIEQKLKSTELVHNVFSITTMYKSINQMLNSNRKEAYAMPDSLGFVKAQRYLKKIPESTSAVLVSKDKRKARITGKVNDLGADNIKAINLDVQKWIEKNIDGEMMEIRQTGTGVIIDKNAEYLRDNLIQGLGLALLIVSFLMMFLFKDWRYLIISLIPNIFPLIFAAAVLGYFSIELEATISIIFALSFGIAVDDTIHFLSKYKLSLAKLGDKELAIQATFRETGKAIIFTSIILFFGFLVMLFSIHPPSVVIGLLISVTLLSAVVSDLSLIPWLIRKLT